MSYTNVNSLATSIIRPASFNDITQHIDLTPWDLILLPFQYMQKGLLFSSKSKQDKESSSSSNASSSGGGAGGASDAGSGGGGGGMICHLKTSLSHTLDHFYPLAGRLATRKHEDDTISFYINCNSAGVEFIHAIADDISVSDITSSTYLPRIVQSFFSLSGVKNSEGESYPLLSVQVTELIDGIFMGFTANHAVCDGTSFWHFVNSWSEISKGLLSSKTCTILRPPILKRWFLKDTDCPIRLPFSSTNKILSRKIEHNPSEERGFHFTRENVERLKAKANLQISDPTYDISSLQALLAHIWVAVIRARNLDVDEETSYILLTGTRSKVSPPLAEEYFGNSIGVEFATSKVGDLLDKGLGWGALILHKTVHTSQNDASVRGFLGRLMESNNMVGFHGEAMASNVLTARSSPRFNMYGNDFGWGRPVAVRTGMSDKYDGTTTLSPGAVDGSIDIEICYPLEILKAMENDVEFMEFVNDR